MAVAGAVGVDGVDRESRDELGLRPRSGQPCAAFADADDQRGVQSPCHPLNQRAERSLVHRQSQPSGDEDRLPFVARPDRTVFDHFAERLVVDVGHHRRRVEQREETAIRRGPAHECPQALAGMVREGVSADVHDIAIGRFDAFGRWIRRRGLSAPRIEMKVRSDKDSTGFKKISLIDKLSLGMSYNMAADSFKWSDLSVGLRLKLSKSYTLNLNGQFDTYTYDENGHRVDIPRWKAGKGIGRLRGTSTSFSYTFNNDTFKKLFGGGDSSSDKSGNQSASTDPNADPDGLNPDGEGEGENKESGGRLLGKKKETGETDADGYLISKIPWSLSFSYGLSLRYGDFNRSKLEYDYALTHSLSFNGNIQPTKNWRFNFNATYDFDAKKISYMTCNVTRNLHCWQMTASFVPVGPYKSYTFSIAVSSALLKDLKYDKRSNYRDGQQWY